MKWATEYEEKGNMEMNGKKLPAFRFSVAPMMDWTDRHCRYFHRLMTKDSLLYTEMIAASAIVYGETDKILDHNQFEYPLALQVGGSDPDILGNAVAKCVGRGFCEINLNSGCPSNKVQEGSFGAILMKDPQRISECLIAMKEVSREIEITLKCRIGVDDQDPTITLPLFLESVIQSGVKRVAIHSRKAWLQGLSPKQNRSTPPLNHSLVLKMKKEFPELKICINGGIESLNQAEQFLAQGIDGVMIGRSAYRNPAQLLMEVDRRFFGDHADSRSVEHVLISMMKYINRHVENGGKVTAVTRHMMGLYAGRQGAKIWRRELSNPALNSSIGLELLKQAIGKVEGEEFAAKIDETLSDEKKFRQDYVNDLDSSSPARAAISNLL